MDLLIAAILAIIPIELEECDRPAYGFYFPDHNVLLLCEENIDSNEILLETLKHEATHLIQDCKAGLDNDEFETIYNKDLIMKNATDYALISVFTNEAYTSRSDHVQWLEVEAFTYESRPINWIVNLIDFYCS